MENRKEANVTKASPIFAFKKTTYRCSICGAEYDDRKKAEQGCESYELEPPRFKVGDAVVFNGLEKYPNLVAKVTSRIGPVIGNKCRADGRRLIGTGAHVYQYKLKPLVKLDVDIREWVFWTSELRPVKM